MIPKGDRGTGLVVATATIPMAVVTLLFLTQVALRLHADSRLSAAAEHAVRVAADDGGRVDRAERALRAALGPPGRAAVVDWSVADGQVTLVVEVRAPVLRALGGVDLLPERLSRSARARIERWR